VLGTAGGGIDGGQWQLPMPQMISSGAITNGRVASNSVKKADLDLNTKGDGKFFKQFETKNKRKSGPPTPSPRPTRTSGSATG
jgi:bicarbonate transport system substrate-binding protein